MMLYLESHNEQNNSSNAQQAADDLALQQTRAVDARWREVEEGRRRPANKGLEQANIPLTRMSSNERRPRHRGIEGSNGQHDGRDICPSLECQSHLGCGSELASVYWSTHDRRCRERRLVTAMSSTQDVMLHSNVLGCILCHYRTKSLSNKLIDSVSGDLGVLLEYEDVISGLYNKGWKMICI
jgi:hypothetical protein